MKESPEKPDPKQKGKKPDNKEKDNQSVPSVQEDERKGYGILPDRDLKKNLGCG